MKRFKDLLSEELAKTNARIVQILKSREPLMQEIMDWILQCKGKQLRPRFLIAAAQLRGKRVDATEYAAMLEIVHMASLVHDDVIDRAETRRGVDSVYSKYGTKMAIYAGDYMMFSLFSRTAIKPALEHRKMYNTLCSVCDGELGQNSCMYDLSVTEEQYLENIRGKSAALFALACELGARAAKLGDAAALNMRRFGEGFGILFQLYDDFLDLGLGEVDIGKPMCQDIANGIYSLPVIYALDCAETQEATRTLLLRAKEVPSGTDIRSVHDVLARSKALERCLALVDRKRDEANAALADFKDNEARGYFQAALDALYEKIRTAIQTGLSR